MRASLDAAQAYGRRLMASTCVVSRVEGEPVFDPGTGEYDEPPTVEVYSGPCKIVPTGGERVVEFGEGPTTVRTYSVNLEGVVEDIEVGDMVVVAGSRDSDLDGRELVVLDVPKSDWITHRHLVVEERV